MPDKKTKKKFTKAQLKKLKKYWKKLNDLQRQLDLSVAVLENAMQKDVKIDDVEFFWVDEGYCGIGNMARTMELVPSYILEDEK